MLDEPRAGQHALHVGFERRPAAALPKSPSALKSSTITKPPFFMYARSAALLRSVIVHQLTSMM